MTEWLTVRVRFRPHPLVRFGILFPTGGIPLGIVSTWSPSYSSSDFWGAAATVIICAMIAVKWIFFTGAVCSESHLLICGLFWSRRVPRDAILGLSKDYVFVRWRNSWGRIVYSPMGPFWSEPSGLHFVSDYNHRVVKTIWEWVKAGPGHVVERSTTGRH